MKSAIEQTVVLEFPHGAGRSGANPSRHRTLKFSITKKYLMR
jgi:hypothetical protein